MSEQQAARAQVTKRLSTIVRRLRRKVLIVAKLLMQRIANVPPTSDVLFLCAWDWRYPAYLYKSLSPGQVIECPQKDLPFVLEYASLKTFFFQTRATVPGEAPVTATVISRRVQDLTGSFSRRILISDDYYAPSQPPGTVRMPYFCHPDVYRQRLDRRMIHLRGRQRRIGLFFAGGVDEHGYESGFTFPMMTRTEILRTMHRHFGASITIVQSRKDLAQIRNGHRPVLFVLSHDTDPTTARHLLSLSEYFDCLAASNFFLAPPGVVMPHCHNLIEAMSVGAIPVTNYGGYMTPPLRNDVECVSFGDATDLVAQVQRALAMPAAAVAEMRARVISYYDEHLQPSAFRRLVDATTGDVTVLVNAERGRDTQLSGATRPVTHLVDQG